MRLKSVEENGNVTVITGSFFGELNLTVTNKEGEVIHEFSGTLSEMKKMQEMTQEESGEPYNYEENQEDFVENGSDVEETETFADDRPKPIVVDLDYGDKVELIKDHETDVYKEGDILTVLKYFKGFDGYQVTGNDRSQIVKRSSLKPLGEKSKFFVLNKRGEDISSSFKEDTIVKVVDDDFELSLVTEDSTGVKQRFGTAEFKFPLVDENGLDDGIEELFEFAEENGIRLTVDNLNEVKEQKEKSINKIKLQPNTLYYLKERIFDNSGDSAGPGLVTFDDKYSAVGFIDQYDKDPVALDGHYLEKDKIFKVKKEDIVKVVSAWKSGNSVVGKTGFLLRINEKVNELIKGQDLPAPYVDLEEVEPVSDKKAQKFIDKEIAKTRTRG